MYKNYDEPDTIRTRVALVSDCAYPWTDVYVTRRKKGDASGVDIPDFRMRLKRGDLLPHQPYEKYDMLATQEWTRCQDLKPITCKGNPNFRPWTISGFDVSSYWATRGDLFALTTELANAGTYLVNKAMSKCSGSVDLADFFAELLKTAEQLKALAPAIADFMRRRPKLNDPASVWLTWRMGIQPLINDLKDIAEYLENPPEVKSIVRGLAERADSNIRTQKYSGIPVDGQGSKCSITLSDHYTIHQNGRAAIKNPIYKSRKEMNWNLAGAYWEVVPWSFVVDKFYDVSNFIRALTVAVVTPLSSRTSSHGMKLIFERVITVSDLTPGSVVERISITGESRQTAICIVRVPHDVDYPQFLPRLSWETIIDLIMLALAQAARIVALATPGITQPRRL